MDISQAENIIQMREKNKVAMSSVVAAVFLTVIKLAVGMATGSLGILSEAAHSSLDLVAAIVTAVAVRISGKPADNAHHYGHGKVESFSALIETILLFITCGWVVTEAVKRLITHDYMVEANLWSFACIIISIVIGINRALMLKRAAQKYKSQALEADALHFESDVYSSFVVLIGLGLVKLGFPIGDPIAALGVALLVIVATVRLGKDTVDTLLDKAPEGVVDDIAQSVVKVEGVRSCPSIRVRQAGNHAFADVQIELFHDLHLEEVEEIMNRVEDRIRELLPNADVMVHPVSVEHPEELEAIVHTKHKVEREPLPALPEAVE